ncbi:hypothetical protein JZ751_008355 [Albula glossodonta]|uniref:Fibrinogen C-terminal domain-containing protein n=1 Tax=Albula glossodonta TaxID=121402 RepID=A0A8T2N300_9TELE|nr:hypothetical protein JZ751_008355 [Albula glossodonta]
MCLLRFLGAAGFFSHNSLLNLAWRDCSDIQETMDAVSKIPSGIYIIQPEDTDFAFEAFCEMDYMGGGWTVIQRRTDGLTDFKRAWTDYADGFGHLPGEHWLGLRKLFSIVNQKNARFQLHVALVSQDDTTAYASYDDFRIDDEKEFFAIHLGRYAGSAGSAGERRAVKLCHSPGPIRRQRRYSGSAGERRSVKLYHSPGPIRRQRSRLAENCTCKPSVKCRPSIAAVKWRHMYASLHSPELRELAAVRGGVQQNQDTAPFSTSDVDNDGCRPLCTFEGQAAESCSARQNNTGWWFNSCGLSNLNGSPLDTELSPQPHIRWDTWTKSGVAVSIKAVTMKVKRIYTPIHN